MTQSKTLFVFFTLLALVIAGCSDSAVDVPQDLPATDETALQATVDDAVANPMSREDSEAYSRLVAQQNRDNRSFANHFYTTTDEERDSAVEDGYRFEDRIGSVFATDGEGRAPFYRLFSEANSDHFYTTNKEERDLALQQDFVDEGNAGYIYTADGPDRQPLYRLYNLALSDHFYTTDKAERDNVLKDEEWNDEGIAGYLPTAGADLLPFYRLYQEIPATLCTGDLDEDEREVLFGIVVNSIEGGQATPDSLNRLSESLVEDYGCDYGINGNLLTQWAGSGVVAFNFTEFADRLEAQKAEISLSPEQEPLFDAAVDVFKEAGTQLITYDDANLNFPFDNESALLASIEIESFSGIGGSLCDGGGSCATPNGASQSIETPAGSLNFSFDESGFTFGVSKDALPIEIPVIDLGIGANLTFDEGGSVLEALTPDSASIYLEAGGCAFGAGILCGGAQTGLQFKDFPDPGEILDIPVDFPDLLSTSRAASEVEALNTFRSAAYEEVRGLEVSSAGL